MRLLSLGHSAYLLEMEPAGGGGAVRILADPWLGDHVIGDLQGRFPRLRFEVSALGRLDAIYLSHSHTDHLDPYSLARLWSELDHRPVVVLPQSLRFLAGLLREGLDGVELHFLEDRQPFDLRGLSLMGFFNPETAATNEDDVMVLLARNGREVFLAESDALLPFYHPEGRELVSSLLLEDDPETVCFATTRNEGEATMSMLSAREPEDRRRRFDRSLERTYGEIDELYAPIEEVGDDLWRCDRLVRLIGGQGICFPQALAAEWNRVLFPIRVEDRVRMEREVAAQHGCRHAVEPLAAGCFHVLDGGRLLGREEHGSIELLDREDDRRFDPGLALFEEFPCAPLHDEKRDVDAQARKIAECLERRFLPHLIAARNPPLEHLLAGGGGRYAVRVRYGTAASHRDRDHEATFERLRFEEAEPAGEPDEHYWANDIEDFLDGQCDEFSTFCRRPLPARAQRLWLCLGLPYLNNDLIERKLRRHFVRAARGEPLETWVLGFWRSAGFV